MYLDSGGSLLGTTVHVENESIERLDALIHVFLRLTLAFTFSYDEGLTNEKQTRKTSYMGRGN